MQTRYTPDEEGDANVLAEVLSKGQKGKFLLHPVKKVTRNYMSVFLCS